MGYTPKGSRERARKDGCGHGVSVTVEEAYPSALPLQMCFISIIARVSGDTFACYLGVEQDVETAPPPLAPKNVCFQ